LLATIPVGLLIVLFVLAGIVPGESAARPEDQVAPVAWQPQAVVYNPLVATMIGVLAT